MVSAAINAASALAGLPLSHLGNSPGALPAGKRQRDPRHDAEPGLMNGQSGMGSPLGRSAFDATPAGVQVRLARGDRRALRDRLTSRLVEPWTAPATWP